MYSVVCWRCADGVCARVQTQAIKNIKAKPHKYYKDEAQDGESEAEKDKAAATPDSKPADHESDNDSDVENGESDVEDDKDGK